MEVTIRTTLSVPAKRVYCQKYMGTTICQSTVDGGAVTLVHAAPGLLLVSAGGETATIEIGDLARAVAGIGDKISREEARKAAGLVRHG